MVVGAGILSSEVPLINPLSRHSLSALDARPPACVPVLRIKKRGTAKAFPRLGLRT